MSDKPRVWWMAWNGSETHEFPVHIYPYDVKPSRAYEHWVRVREVTDEPSLEVHYPNGICKDVRATSNVPSMVNCKTCLEYIGRLIIQLKEDNIQLEAQLREAVGIVSDNPYPNLKARNWLSRTKELLGESK